MRIWTSVLKVFGSESKDGGCTFWPSSLLADDFTSVDSWLRSKKVDDDVFGPDEDLSFEAIVPQASSTRNIATGAFVSILASLFRLAGTLSLS